MTESIKALLEQRHNVTIDAEAEMYTRDNPSVDNRYGMSRAAVLLACSYLGHLTKDEFTVSP